MRRREHPAGAVEGDEEVGRAGGAAVAVDVAGRVGRPVDDHDLAAEAVEPVQHPAVEVGVDDAGPPQVHPGGGGPDLEADAAERHRGGGQANSRLDDGAGPPQVGQQQRDDRGEGGRQQRRSGPGRPFDGPGTQRQGCFHGPSIAPGRLRGTGNAPLPWLPSWVR